MDKNSILNELNFFIKNLKNDIVIGFGSAMVLRDIKDTTSDIDVYPKCLQTLWKLLEALTHEPRLPTRWEHGHLIVELSENIDFHVDLLDDLTYDDINGYNVMCVSTISDYKSRWARDKDVQDILLIKNYLTK